MARVRWKIVGPRTLLHWLTSRLKNNWYLLKITVYSLFYNSFLDIYYVADTAMEPMFWCVDHFTKVFGPIFVALVCILIISSVVIAYCIGVPFYWDQPCLLVALVVLGNWILLNMVFHFYMAASTSPGFPPEGSEIRDAVSICKKCIAPKPPRTHHCSICNKCILKMDHHCPWLDSCVGHYNHRFFYMYCVYTMSGTLYIVIFGLPVLLDHMYGIKVNATDMVALNLEFTDNLQVNLSDLVAVQRAWYQWDKYSHWYHVCVVFMTILILGVLIALGTLTVWHTRMIGKGETSVESHINKSERKRLAKQHKVYVNPYDFGKRINWRRFTGMDQGKTWRHILLPSTHKPLGDGLGWDTIHDVKDKGEDR